MSTIQSHALHAFLSLTVAITAIACSSATKDGLHAGPEPTIFAGAVTAYYVGDFELIVGRKIQKTSALLRRTQMTNAGKIEEVYVFRDWLRGLPPREKQGEPPEWVHALNRIGTTNVFFASDLERTYQGRVTFTAGETWNWSEWDYGFTTLSHLTVTGGGRLTGDGIKVDLEIDRGNGSDVGRARASFREISRDRFAEILSGFKEVQPAAVAE